MFGIDKVLVLGLEIGLYVIVPLVVCVVIGVRSVVSVVAIDDP